MKMCVMGKRSPYVTLRLRGSGCGNSPEVMSLLNVTFILNVSNSEISNNEDIQNLPWDIKLIKVN